MKILLGTFQVPWDHTYATPALANHLGDLSDQLVGAGVERVVEGTYQAFNYTKSQWLPY